MWVNWGKQSMQFQLENKWVELQGEGKGVAEQVAFQSLFGKPYHMVEGLLLCTELQISHSRPLGFDRDVLSDQPFSEITSLLDGYFKIFREPKGLSPQRGKEHAITLMEGQGLVNVRPYRYPHHHKNEIEKQVKQLMDTTWFVPVKVHFQAR